MTQQQLSDSPMTDAPGTSGESNNIAEVVSKKRKLPADSAQQGKRRKVEQPIHHFTNPGLVLAVGEGDTGQLGLGENITERSRPTRVTTNLPPQASVIQVCAGGMHSVCLLADPEQGTVVTFGCNDECALGRVCVEDEDAAYPGAVAFPDGVSIVMVSAGDSHTAALSSDGHVFVWGTFRDNNGVLGLLGPGQKSAVPLEVAMGTIRVVKIASGSDHLVCLSEDGLVYTMGCGEQGQLGRVAEQFVKGGGRKGLDLLLHPAPCRVRPPSLRFSDVWAGAYVTMARCATTNAIYACGLNNFGQLGLPPGREPHFMLTRVDTLSSPAGTVGERGTWTQFAMGQHHTLGLDSKGVVHAFGRSEYGRLGLGPIPQQPACAAGANGEGASADKPEEDHIPHPISVLAEQGAFCVQICCGTACSFALDDKGVFYSWGMGGKHLGHGDDEDDSFVPTRMEGKQVDNRNGIMISAGGQHTLLLVKELAHLPSSGTETGGGGASPMAISS